MSIFTFLQCLLFLYESHFQILLKRKPWPLVSRGIPLFLLGIAAELESQVKEPVFCPFPFFLREWEITSSQSVLVCFPFCLNYSRFSPAFLHIMSELCFGFLVREGYSHENKPTFSDNFYLLYITSQSCYITILYYSNSLYLLFLSLKFS